MNQTTEVACPFCAEKIQALAKICKHCKQILDPQLRELDELRKQKQAAAITPQPPQYIYAPHPAAQKKNFGHGKHFLISLISAGFWIPFWVYFYASRDQNVFH